ncbi:retrovirus-related Pol polyprotein from transposon TNT 1-94 [Trichonephila clavipes]|nr:retrovirus-related Pol polyprotein from transposon TNT 1-94 [Trichonephila clavipes]
MELLKGSQHLTPQNKMEPVNEKCETPLKWPEHSNIQILRSVSLQLSAIYILNRTGKSSIENTSPYELWLKKKLRLKHLRIIGSPCYAHVPAQKRRKMDKNAMQGYLVGYDGDERYRTWLKKEHRVILSRDVIFQEKAGKCDDRTELKLEDRIRGDTNQGKYEEQLIKIEDNPMEKTLSQEDLSDSETDREEDTEPTSDRQLTSAETKTRFEDHIMEAESYLDDYNPETYEEAINSKDSTNWKKAMESERNSLSENHTWETYQLELKQYPVSGFIDSKQIQMAASINIKQDLLQEALVNARALITVKHTAQ